MFGRPQKKRIPKITREQALRAKPVAARIIAREPTPEGGERLLVPMQPTTMQRLVLRIKGDINREFELDAMGVEVLNLCDGDKTVKYIIRRFSKDHDMNHAESEQAVASFLRTLMAKGLVVMVTPKR